MGEVAEDQLIPWVHGSPGTPTVRGCPCWGHALPQAEPSLLIGLWVGVQQVWVGASLLKSHIAQPL